MKRKTVQRIILVVWLCILAAFWGYYLYNPEFISAENISNFMLRFKSHLLITYAVMFVLRPFTMLPGATFVIVGTIIFPTSLEVILILSICCELISSSIIYFFSDFMGFDEYFQKKYPKKMNYIKGKMESKSGFGFMLLWCSTPFVPSDLVFYLAGSLHINYKKFILAVFLGHIVLYSIYVYFTDIFLKVII